MNRHDVLIPAGKVSLAGTLSLPDSPLGIVAFAHGSGSSRHSPRNQYVAGVLQEHRIATLLFDLLTPQEDRTTATRFDIDLLTERLLAAIDWLEASKETQGMYPFGYPHRKLGCFGASTGAAAALISASRRGSIHAVVSRGGRPDLAGDALEHVCAPTLLIVGGRDEEVLRLNREAYLRLCGKKDLVVVPGASHLFEERGALEQVAEWACEWFAQHLGGSWPSC